MWSIGPIPDFVDITSTTDPHAYDLKKGSQAIDVGVTNAAVAADLTTDFVDRPRPVGEYDLGAFEYQGDAAGGITGSGGTVAVPSNGGAPAAGGAKSGGGAPGTGGVKAGAGAPGYWRCPRAEPAQRTSRPAALQLRVVPPMARPRQPPVAQRARTARRRADRLPTRATQPMRRWSDC